MVAARVRTLGEDTDRRCRRPRCLRRRPRGPRRRRRLPSPTGTASRRPLEIAREAAGRRVVVQPLVDPADAKSEDCSRPCRDRSRRRPTARNRWARSCGPGSCVHRRCRGRAVLCCRTRRRRGRRRAAAPTGGPRCRRRCGISGGVPRGILKRGREAVQSAASRSGCCCPAARRIRPRTFGNGPCAHSAAVERIDVVSVGALPKIGRMSSYGVRNLPIFSVPQSPWSPTKVSRLARPSSERFRCRPGCWTRSERSRPGHGRDIRGRARRGATNCCSRA